MTILMSLLTSFLSIVCLMSLVWMISVKKKDASLVDRVWGLNFILIVTVYLFLSPERTPQMVLIWILASIWGLRLSWHIHTRNRLHGEDYRYKTMRENHGEKFWWYSFFSVFLLQGFLSWIISAPLHWIFLSPIHSFALLDFLALAMWSLGFYFEAVGDWELKQFKLNPQNKGRICNIGLWSLCRHPNYFGDAVIWWSFYIFALNTPYGYLSFFGPLLMTLFLRYVSGVTLLEKNMRQKNTEYIEYIANTPAFIPNIFKLKRK